jgi:prepilin-type N-terminal cleavage/methylation domain-containing protein
VNSRHELRRTSGFTLIEMIAVMGIMALLFGMGIGMLSTLDPGKRAALGLVQNVVRAARNNAIARAAPARVRLDVAERTLTSNGMDVLGTWQFESMDLAGSSGIDGVTRGGHLLEHGYLGHALSFSGGGSGAHAQIHVQQDPGFTLREGFMIQCAVLFTGSTGARVLDIGSVAGLETRPDGSLRAWFKPELISTSGVVSGGGIQAVDSPAGLLAPNRWTRIAVTYDRRLLKLLVDGVEVGRSASEDFVWSLQGPLLIGDPRIPFQGAIDALTILGVVDSDVISLPKGVNFASTAPRQIVFSEDGALDRELYRGPLDIGLEYEDGSKGVVRINVYGTVE